MTTLFLVSLVHYEGRSLDLAIRLGPLSFTLIVEIEREG